MSNANAPVNGRPQSGFFLFLDFLVYILRIFGHKLANLSMNTSGISMWTIFLVSVTLFVNFIQIKLVSENTQRCHGKPPMKTVAEDNEIKYDRNKQIGQDSSVGRAADLHARGPGFTQG